MLIVPFNLQSSRRSDYDQPILVAFTLNPVSPISLSGFASAEDSMSYRLGNMIFDEIAPGTVPRKLPCHLNLDEKTRQAID